MENKAASPNHRSKQIKLQSTSHVSTENPWKTLSSREIYKNPWIRVREDQVTRPDGNPGIYGVVESRLAIGVVAVTETEEIYLVGQYRYPTEHYSWEIIEGGIEPGEDPLEGAQRELAEEAELAANSWERLGDEIHLSNCHSSERGLIYLARGLSARQVPKDPTEKIAVRRVTLDEALHLVDDGTIKDVMSIVGILRFARSRGGSK